jgi:hypothetical protein
LLLEDEPPSHSGPVQLSLRIANVEWDSGTLRGLYRRKPIEGDQGVPPIEDRLGGSRAPERLDLQVDETPAR